MIKSIALCLLCSAQLQAAGIEKHFKKTGDKSGMRSIPNIDFIYMINLDRRPEKYMMTMQAFEPFEISPYRFSAVNGWELSFETLDEIGVFYRPGTPAGPLGTVFRHVDGKEYKSNEIMNEEGVSYFCHSMSRGAIGCIMSHLSVLQDAYDSGYETIWVLEDDICVERDPHELSTLIEDLDRLAPGWDVLFTDPEIKGGNGQLVYCGGILPRPYFQSQPLWYYSQRAYLNDDLMKMGIRYGSHSMIIRRCGVEKLLDFYKTYKIFFPYDMDYFLPPGIRMYGCRRDIVTVPGGGISDNGSPNYEKKAP